jgi:signal transduction histidine kinase/phage shock protein PspC (stress-responsive transcriptional regulator)
MPSPSRSRILGPPPALARCPDDRMVAGVCAGVARWIGVDPLVVRLATVLLTLANGVGAVGYLVAWVVLPEAPEPSESPDSLPPQGPPAAPWWAIPAAPPADPGATAAVGRSGSTGPVTADPAATGGIVAAGTARAGAEGGDAPGDAAGPGRVFPEGAAGAAATEATATDGADGTAVTAATAGVAADGAAGAPDVATGAADGAAGASDVAAGAAGGTADPRAVASHVAGTRPSPGHGGGGAAGGPGHGGGGAGAASAAAGPSAELTLAVGCITLGILVLVRWSVPFFPDGLVWPAAIAALGAGLVLTRVSEQDRARWADAASRLPGNPVEVLRGGRALWLRIVIGTGLLMLGIASFLAANDAFSAVGQVGIAVLATALGLAVVFAPWVVRLVRQLRSERRERIRSEERADMAAHLHDSVLQTLALIQRHADAPDESRSLARRQERELRAWLYDDRGRAGADGDPATLARALEQMTDEVEADHRGVAVDVVMVGDCALDPGVEAMVRAVREAVVNAAVHSGASEVSVYAEVAGGRIEAYVRDRGCGFDPAAVGGDRQGIAQSIVGRMARHGGRAVVTSAAGQGTEVSFEVACGPGSTG